MSRYFCNSCHDGKIPINASCYGCGRASRAFVMPSSPYVLECVQVTDTLSQHPPRRFDDNGSNVLYCIKLENPPSQHPPRRF